MRSLQEFLGRPGAGRDRRDTPSAPARGRVVRQNVGHATVPLFGAEPFGLALASLLALGYRTGSPMSGGRDAVTLNTGAGIVGRDARRTPALQTFGAAARPIQLPRARSLGAQAGPSQPAAFPSTGQSGTPSIYGSLAQIGLPNILDHPPVPGVRS